MPGASTQPDIADPGLGAAAFGKVARKITVLVGTDDFSASRFAVLWGVLGELAREVVILARPSGEGQFQDLGASVIAFDPRASLTHPARDALNAWKLARILEAENADAVHVVGVRSAVLCGLALKLIASGPAMVHLPDVEALETTVPRLPRLYRFSPAKVIDRLVRQPSSFLLVESSADLTRLRAKGIEHGARAAVVNGSGIDLDAFPLLPPAQGEVPIAACLAPMSTASGIEVLMRAFERLWARGVRTELELAGEQSDGADAISPDDMARWSLHPGVRCSGPVSDVREVLRRAEICVLPAVKQQGLPRAALEAAACGRALIVTEYAGGGNFVRHDVEGLVVPAGDVAALAAALEQVARDPDLRGRLGQAARLRVLQGFTEAHVRQTLRGAYLTLLEGSRPDQRAR